MTATQVITVSVYGVDDALCTVRLYAAWVAGMTLGYSPTNGWVPPSPRVGGVPATPHPPRPRRVAYRPPTRHSAATPASNADQAVPRMSCVQPRNASASTAATS